MEPRHRRVAAVIGGLAVLLGGSAFVRSGAATRPDAFTIQNNDAAVIELHVHHLCGGITLDGDLDDPGWAGPIARTGEFLDGSGSGGHPYSDARLAWGDGHLYLALYAADEDIHATLTDKDSPVWQEDAFHLAFDKDGEERIFDISAIGTVADAARHRLGTSAGALDYGWTSGAHVSHEIDGTLDVRGDYDEEWALEVAIPFSALGIPGRPGDRIRFEARRCDTPHGSRRVCTAWGSGHRGVLILD